MPILLFLDSNSLTYILDPTIQRFLGGRRGARSAYNYNEITILDLAVCGRLRKSNYFLERVHVPDRSGTRSCLGEREASLPQTATQSHGFASQPGGGKHPHAQDTKPWFCVASKGGACTPMPRTQSPSTTYTGSALRKPSFLRLRGGGACPPPHETQNHRFASPTQVLDLKSRFRHQCDARSSPFGNLHNLI